MQQIYLLIGKQGTEIDCDFYDFQYYKKMSKVFAYSRVSANFVNDVMKIAFDG